MKRFFPAMVSSTAIAVLTALLLSCPRPAYPQEKMRIAVMDLKADGVPKKTALLVSDMVRTDMIKTGLFLVVERSQMDLILREQGFQQTGCTDQECAVQLGRLMSARKILIGSVSSLGAAIIINTRIVDVERGIAEFAAREDARTEADLGKAVKQLTSRLAGAVQGLDRYPLSIAVKTLLIIPVGDFAKLLQTGYGGLLNFSYKGLFIPNLTVGLETGYFSFKGDKYNIEKAYMVPLLLNMNYYIPLFGDFAFVPEIMSGVSYDAVEEIGLDGAAEMNSAFQSMSAVGATLQYTLKGRIGFQAGIDYGFIYEPDGLMSFTMVKLGLSAYF